MPRPPETGIYSIAGTPPSLYNDIVGDAFAPRNPYCLRVDTLREPPIDLFMLFLFCGTNYI